jgi:hypothetical protein
MKTYFLALNKSDFNVNGNVWTSNVFDLYSNRFYKNYSTYRSATGLNLLGDYTFVGTELTSSTPTISANATPTNYGEIVFDQSQRRFFSI